MKLGTDYYVDGMMVICKATACQPEDSIEWVNHDTIMLGEEIGDTYSWEWYKKIIEHSPELISTLKSLRPHKEKT